MARKVLLVGLVTVLAGIACLLVFDLVQVHRNTEEYKRVYGFNDAEKHWSHRSVRNYSLQGLLAVAFLATGAGLAVLMLLRPSQSSALLYLYLALLAAFVVRVLLAWWRSGFDH